MAAHTVLSLPELLSLILINVHASTLLFAQRVSKTFRATIQSSPTVQEALFFRLKPSNPRQGPIVMNPWLTKSFPLYNKSLNKTSAWKLILNPFTLASDSSARRMHLSSHAGLMECTTL
nr:hypothetical protein B0A51_01535 [Rachicladosporium sp. CCFEE 5018]